MAHTTTPAAQLTQAVAAHRSGQIERAEHLYREVLEDNPTNADALHLLGVALHQRGQSSAAIGWIEQALRIRPGTVSYLRNLGAVYRAAGSPRRAVTVLRQALQISPDDVATLFNLGNALRDSEEANPAAQCFRRVLALAPDNVPAMLALANVLRQRRELDEAEYLLRPAIARQPRNVDLNNALGMVLQTAGKLAEAAKYYQAAIDCDNRFATGIGNLAGVLHEQGDSATAITLYSRAIELQPDRAELHNQLGLVLRDSGKTVEAKAAFERAMDLEPNSGAAYCNLGSLYNSQGRCDDALEAYEQAARVMPDSAEVHAQLAFHLQNAGLLSRARTHYRLAQRKSTSQGLLIQQKLMLPPVYDSTAHLEHCRREYASGLATLVEQNVTVDPARDIVPVSFYLPYQGQADRALQEQAARLYPSSWSGPADSHVSYRKPGDGRLRVGFISRYFREHTIGRLNEGLIQSLDREQFHVSVITGETAHDPLAESLRNTADEYLVLTHRPADDLAALARLDLDLLYYTDLGMDPVTWTLAHSRVAPVQCVTWGHPVTTGIPQMDCFISARDLDRESATADYSERLVRMEAINVYYRRPLHGESRKKRADFGIPEDRTVYGCLHSVFKLHPDFDSLLRQILERDEQAILVLLRGSSTRWDTALRNRLSRTLAGLTDRIIQVPHQCRADFMRLAELVDVHLEPIHFGGGNTSYEAFSRGVPIVTLPARYLRGRVTSALYRRMDVHDCIAESREHYVDLALRLGQDQDFRRLVSGRIRDTAHVLYEDSAAAREFGRLLARLATESRGGSRSQPRPLVPGPAAAARWGSSSDAAGREA